MLKNIILIAIIFVVVLLALSIGEVAFSQIFAWISSISGVLIQNFGDLFRAISSYLHAHTAKVLLALALTVPLSLWVLRSRHGALEKPASQRRIAIVLAVFLGWLGVHRFFLGQVGWGIGFLVLAWVFVPLAAILGLIDAVRYALMDVESFQSQTR